MLALLFTYHATYFDDDNLNEFIFMHENCSRLTKIPLKFLSKLQVDRQY